MSGAPSFSNPQHQQKIEELVSIAKEQGYLTYEEINDILPMTFDSPEQIIQRSELASLYFSGDLLDRAIRSSIDFQLATSMQNWSALERALQKTAAIKRISDRIRIPLREHLDVMLTERG